MDKALRKIAIKKENVLKRSKGKDIPETEKETVDKNALLEINKIINENIRREKAAAVEHQHEKFKTLLDGEKVNEELYHNLLCGSFIDNLKKLINEIRGSQIYVDSEGIVTKRHTAKTALRKVDKTV